jgi:hypothetical protein
MAETKKIYVVAEGCSFVGNKKSYKAGDEIDASAFKDDKRFKSFIESKKIIEKTAPEEKKEEKTFDRAAAEKLAVEKGLAKNDQVSKLKDDELEKLLKDAGLLK